MHVPQVQEALANIAAPTDHKDADVGLPADTATHEPRHVPPPFKKMKTVHQVLRQTMLTEIGIYNLYIYLHIYIYLYIYTHFIFTYVDFPLYIYTCIYSNI